MRRLMARLNAGVIATAAVMVLLPFSARAITPLSSGALLTNFASATFSLPSGGGVTDTDAGTNIINIPNSQSAWILVTDSPQLCLKVWKSATDASWNPLVTAGTPNGQYPGGVVCFQIS